MEPLGQAIRQAMKQAIWRYHEAFVLNIHGTYAKLAAAYITAKYPISASPYGAVRAIPYQWDAEAF